jgi:hypothetical protein
MAESHIAQLRSDQPIQFSHQINTTLTNDNYLIWKSQILPVLRGHGLISFIEESSSVPATTISIATGTVQSNPAFERWQNQDQLFLAWLFNSLSSDTSAQL